MNDSVLEINHLTKQYKNVTAVNQLSLTVKKGQVFGILGPNGSGKTSTLAMILGVIYPTSGSYSWFGSGTGHEMRLRIGSLLETPNFYPGLSARQNLKIIAEVKKLSDPAIDETLKKVGLLERAESAFKSFSLGMKQRLAIGAALLGKPDVLVLDEPTNGLDPQGIAEIRTLIKDLSKQQITIILASHLLDEVQKVCTDVCIIRKGRLLYSGSLLVSDHANYYVEMTGNDPDALAAICKTHPGVSGLSREGEKLVMQVKQDYPITEFHRFLIEKGIVLTSLQSYHLDLESKYLEIIKE